ncbi:TylF/MycF family methyltransferase [Flavobacteriaceae bacterium]|nr:TylF/MycF family methyltransferase [Flavobacteriaceae bacterium]
MKKIILKVINLLGLLRGNINRNDNFSALYRAWGYIYSNHNFSGDYVEFGVYRGDGVVNSLIAQREFHRWLENQKKSSEKLRREVSLNSIHNRLPTFHLLDTFDSMPENNEGETQFAKDTFTTNLKSVKEKVENNNKLKLKIKFYKGLFVNQTIEFNRSFKNRKIAIANIDCDLAMSTTDALNMIEDKIDIGTILLFDDYNAFNADKNKGQRLAFKKFCNNTNFEFEKFFTYHLVGQSFLTIGKKN